MIVYDLSNDDYHSHAAVSKSGLDKVNRSIADYKHYRKNRAEPKAKRMGRDDARALGTVVHDLSLTPIDEHPKPREYAVYGEPWATEDRPPMLVSEACFKKAEAMSDKLKAHIPVKLRTGIVEASIFWTEQTRPDLPKLGCRARPDLLGDPKASRFVVLDVKTGEDISFYAFMRSIRRYRYHVQAAFYNRGIKDHFGREPTDWIFACVQSNPPHNVMLYLMDPADIAIGDQAVTANLSRLAEYKHDLKIAKAKGNPEPYDGFYPPNSDSWIPGSIVPITAFGKK